MSGINHIEECKRKYHGMGTVVKNSQQYGYFHPIMERKKTQLSKEKQNKKIITTVDKHPKAKHKLSHQINDEYEMKTNTKGCNFRHLKDMRRQNDLIKTQPYHHMKPHKEYFQKVIRSKHVAEEGISINVNIQNMLPVKKKITPIEELYENNMKSERSVGIEEHNQSKSRKNTKVNSYLKVDDLECGEELLVKKNQVETKGKIHEKLGEKKPLISRKTHTKNSPQQKDPHFQNKQLLRKFQEQVQHINSLNEYETLLHMDHRQNAYQILPHYIERKQKYFSWMMRAILVEWMMHVSYQFSLKRQTFHLAVCLVDLFMCEELHLSKGDFQLIGATTMFIASKLEEFEPKCSEEFANSTDGRYSALEIKQTEKKICKSLKFSINPPTLFMWANRFMLQWDNYIDTDFYALNHPLFTTSKRCYFKKYDEGASYKNFRILMQLIDCALLDIQSSQYKNKLLVCAFMYLVLGKTFNEFKMKEIVHEFPRSSLYLLDQDNLFNDLFMNFLQGSFGISLSQLLPTIQYSATYFILTLNFEPPITQQQNVSTAIEFEQYCCLQTYNPNMKTVISRRFRGIYE